MLRILCLIESLGSGGAERQLTGLAVMLKQQGYTVEVWYYDDNGFYLSFLQENGVIGRYLSDATNPQKRFFALRKSIKAFNPDTIISYSASSSMIACLLKLLGAKFKLIVSERNTTQDLSRRNKMRFFLYRWADVIVPNSFSQGAFIDSHFSHLTPKVKVITNFVDTAKFSPSDSLTPFHKETKIICVGRIVPQKNLPKFIKAVGKVVRDGFSIKVDWYGQVFNIDYAEECNRIIKENQLEKVFFFNPPYSEIQEKYRESDVFCLPSIYEGFPNVLCEAMSCGLPILCSRVCDNPSIVQEEINAYMFDPNDIEEIVLAIEKFLKLSRDKIRSMGEKSRERSLELFSIKNFIDKYMGII